MIRPIGRHELLSLLESEGTQLVDVLPNGEYTATHIPGAINIPLKTLNSETASRLRRDKPVVVY